MSDHNSEGLDESIDIKPDPEVEIINNNNILESQSEIEMTTLNIDYALKIIPEFNGDQSQLHRFLACVELIHDVLRDSEKPKLVKLLKAKLIGKAYDVVKYNNFETWEDLSAECKLQFSDHRSIEQLQTELVTIKQQRLEDVLTYATRVEKLLSDFTDACISSQGKDSAEIIKSLNSKIALSSFLEGLYNSNIKLIVKACRFETLRGAIMKACEEETIMKSRTSQLFPNVTRSNPICHICKKPGHISSSCYSRNNQIRSQFQQREIKMFTSICAYCKTKGHHISQCRKSKYYNRGTQPNTPSQAKNSLDLEQKLNTVARVQDLI